MFAELGAELLNIIISASSEYQYRRLNSLLCSHSGVEIPATCTSQTPSCKQPSAESLIFFMQFFEMLCLSCVVYPLESD